MDWTEFLLHPSQARDCGSILDDVVHIHGGNQRIYASNKNILLKYYGKDTHVTTTKVTKEEWKALQVMKLTRITRFTPLIANKEEIKRVRNLNIKYHQFDNLH